MKPFPLITLIAFFLTVSTPAQRTAFTYHGQLLQSGQAAGGSFDFRVILYDAEIGGSQVGPILTNLAVTVSRGSLTTSLDFGAGVFDGSPRFLDIAVRPAGAGPFVQLSPRQAITPVPYAHYAATPAGSAGLNWQGEWSEAVLYEVNDAVHFDGSSWLALATNHATKPSASSSIWSLVAQQGAAGPPGQTGAEGPMGPPGPTGPPGPSGAANAWGLSGNAGLSSDSNFIGTTDATAFVIRSANQQAVRYEGQATGLRIVAGVNNSIAASTTNSVISGGRDNTIGSGAHESVISGGLNNIIGDEQRSSVIVGGARNEIRLDNQHGAILGGRDHRIGTNTVISAVVGGGENRLGNNIDGGFIAGGFRNDILGSANPNRRQIAPVLIGGSDNEIGRESGWATIIGGDNNRMGTNCNGSIILGGTNNLMADNSFFSLAAGRRCRVNHSSVWMWADGQNASFASAGNNTFNIRSEGGIHASGDTSMFFGSSTRQMINLWGTIYGIGVQSSTHYFRTVDSGSFSWFRGGTHSNTANSPGVGGVESMRLNSSGLRVNGTFVAASDRDKKDNVKPVNPAEVLDKVAALPISEWNYLDDPGTRHVGPMAQDFHAAFQVGMDDKHIATVDADGVALAAIQGLNLKVQRQAEVIELKDARIHKLERELGELRAFVEQSLAIRNGSQP